MKCQTIQKLYLSFIDEELPETDKIRFQNHLSSCSDCARKLDTLKEIYQPKSSLQKIEPSPFLWQKLYLKISEQEKKAATSLFLEKLLPFAANVGYSVIFIMSILLGIYLGSSPNLTTPERTADAPNVIVNDEFEDDSYISTFDDLPRESIGNVYFTMEME
jgi:hypothetical protein